MARTNRREFLKTTAAAGAITTGFWLDGATAQEQPSANNRLNIAVIGCGGRGEASVSACARTENIVALCDADENRARPERFDDESHFCKISVALKQLCRFVRIELPGRQRTLTLAQIA